MLLQVFDPAPASNMVTLFPNENGGGVMLSSNELESLNTRLSFLYHDLTNSLGQALERHLGLPAKSGAPIARRAIVPLTHLFVDRLVRLQRLRTICQIDEILTAPPYENPKHCDQLTFLASFSFGFNQDVVGRIGQLFSIPRSNQIASDPFEGLPLGDKSTKNHLFFFSGSTKFTRLWQRVQLALSRISGRTIATWMVNTKIPTLEAGLYGHGLFAHMPDQWIFAADPPQPELRKKILGPVLQRHSGHLLRILNEFTASPGISEAMLAEVFIDFCAEYYPVTLFESAAENIDVGIRELSKYPKCNAVYSCGLSLTTQAAFLIAAARATNKKVIGAQHGGHYGYFESMSTCLDIEYPDCDEYVTWGWAAIPEHPALRNSKMIPLPSPWMSRRTEQWKRLLSVSERTGAGKEFDFAFLPNHVYPYVPAPSGGVSTINHVEQFGTILKEVVTGLTGRGYRILLKPHGLYTTRFLQNALESVRLVGKQQLVTYSGFDKGMTPELIRSCNLILWDQPGTGFIECLNAEIPTLVYWPKLYNRENGHSRQLFERLANAQIIHHDLDQLAVAYESFRSGPNEWMANVDRRAAIQSFLRAYGWADHDWPRFWKAYLKSHTD